MAIKNSETAKLAVIASPAALILFCLLPVVDTKRAVIISALALSAGIIILSSIVIRAIGRNQRRLDSIAHTISSNRMKQSRKEYEILANLHGLSSRTTRENELMHQHLSDHEKHLREGLLSLSSLSSTLEKQQRLSNQRGPGEPSSNLAARRNRDAIQDLFTRMLKSQGEILERLSVRDSDSGSNTNNTYGGQID